MSACLTGESARTPAERLEPLLAVLYGWCCAITFITLASCQGLREQIRSRCPRLASGVGRVTPDVIKQAFPDAPQAESIPR